MKPSTLIFSFISLVFGHQTAQSLAPGEGKPSCRQIELRYKVTGDKQPLLAARMISAQEYAQMTGSFNEEDALLPPGISIVAIDAWGLPPNEKFLLCYENISGIGPTFIREFKSSGKGRAYFHDEGSDNEEPKSFINAVQTIKGEPISWLIIRKKNSQCLARIRVIPRPLDISSNGNCISLILESADARNFCAEITGLVPKAIVQGVVKSDNQINISPIIADNEGKARLSFSPVFRDYLSGEALFQLVDPKKESPLEISFEWGKKALHF